MRNRLQPRRALDRDRQHERAHPRPCSRVVVDVHERRAPLPETTRDVEHAAVVSPQRRVELDGDDPLLVGEHPAELRLLRQLHDRERDLALLDNERGARRALLLDRRGDRGDLHRRRPAAAADDPRAQIARVRGEVREVLRRRVREHDAVPGQARQADVGHGREREVAVRRVHLVQGRQCGLDADSVVGADRREACVAQRFDRRLRGHSAERLTLLVEGEHGHDREGGDLPHGLDRLLELVELEEGLDHEEVDAARIERCGLLFEDPAAVVRRDVAELAERADRPGDENVPACDLAGLTSELHPGAVDVLDLVLEEVRAQLPAVGPERVRFDQVGAGVDEADVQGDDRLRRAQIRLFRAAKPRYGAGDERAHTAVADEDRPALQALFEAVRHNGTLRPAPVSEVGQSTPNG